MIFVIGAIILAIANLAVGFVALSRVHIAEYSDISLVCRELKDVENICLQGATQAGLTSLLGLAVVLLLTVLFAQRTHQKEDEQVRPLWHTLLLPCMMVGTGLVYAIYVLGDIFGPHSVSRIDSIANQSSIISLSNLAWPLLLQLANSSPNMRYRLSYLSMALLILSFSPFRGVLLGMVFFGMLLPLCQAFFNRSKPAVQTLHVWQRWPFKIGVILSLLFITVGGIFYQTKSREMNSTEGTEQGVILHHLTQRLAYPLFQAYFAGRLAQLEPLPTAVDDIAAKLRLSHTQNLNEYLYQRIYSYGSVGQMTSLYYGEAAANTSSHPIIWATVAPLSLVMLWLIFRKAGYEIGILIGIALWRGSLGGLAAMLPALAIQIMFMVIGSHKYLFKNFIARRLNTENAL